MITSSIPKSEVLVAYQSDIFEEGTFMETSELHQCLLEVEVNFKSDMIQGVFKDSNLKTFATILRNRISLATKEEVAESIELYETIVKSMGFFNE